MRVKSIQNANNWWLGLGHSNIIEAQIPIVQHHLLILKIGQHNWTLICKIVITKFADQMKGNVKLMTSTEIYHRKKNML